jgi:cation transport ATPase
MSGIDRAARRGIIAKSGATIEQLGRVDVAVFDKTGTLTLGQPEVVDIVLSPSGASIRYDRDTLLWLAASVEQFSTHILAQAVVSAARHLGRPLQIAAQVNEIQGKGLHGQVSQAAPGEPDGGITHDVAVGHRTLMRTLEISIPDALNAARARRAAEGQIGSFIAIDGRIEALLVFADVPRPELKRLADDLKAAGITETWLLTGDGEAVAQRIGALAKVDHVVARCLPQQKVETVRALQEQGHAVLMVGDGVNDAPALASATVGLAMGAQGLTAASAVADAVLLSPDILQVVRAVELGRGIMRVALQGIWIGIGLSLVAMVCAAFGLIPPAMGALLQEGIDALVILNALRATRT